MKRFMKTEGEKCTEILGTRIFLVRHGETDWNRTKRFQGRRDIPLNQEGKKQAHALALALRDESLTAIYSSPLVRAMETAQLIKVFHPSTPVFEEEGLVEMNLGEFDGMDAGSWASQYPDFRKNWRSAPARLAMPGGECLQEVQIRAIDTLDRLTNLYPSGSTLLLCSHNFVNRTLLCHALKIPLDKFREVQQHVGALNLLHKYEGQLRAVAVDDIAYLQKERTFSPTP
jgi:phosphoserine phosphatase